MEVHHHSHTERKKWTHYFWEFFMLFLAVSAGFLVENQREHYVEHKRAKVYAANLYKELKEDTAELSHLMSWTLTLSKRYDTLRKLYTENEGGTTNGKLYYFSSVLGITGYFSSSSSTLEQLKSSGNIRILPTDIALKISYYDKKLRMLESDYTFFRTEFETIIGLSLKIFDGNIAADLFSRHRDEKFRDSVFQLDPPLLNDDPRLMKELMGWVRMEGQWWRNSINEHLMPLNKIASLLIIALKKEYHLE
ncbi:MAG: hypothetical protein E6H07_04635 [Bacteroidetes bacterium]|nr:MAG: hypothetical protein E6H07_04635 [Bacteroidota bacterium]